MFSSQMMPAAVMPSIRGTCQIHGFFTVGRLANDLVAVIFKHADKIHTIHGFVFGDYDGALAILLFLRSFFGTGGGLQLLLGQHGLHSLFAVAGHHYINLVSLGQQTLQM